MNCPFKMPTPKPTLANPKYGNIIKHSKTLLRVTFIRIKVYNRYIRL